MTIAKNTHRMSTRSKTVQKVRAVPVERNIDNGKMPSTVYLMSDIGSSKVTPREQKRLDDLEEEMALRRKAVRLQGEMELLKAEMAVLEGLVAEVAGRLMHGPPDSDSDGDSDDGDSDDEPLGEETASEIELLEDMERGYPLSSPFWQ